MNAIIAMLNTIMQSCKHDYPLVQTARCAFVTRTLLSEPPFAPNGEHIWLQSRRFDLS